MVNYKIIVIFLDQNYQIAKQKQQRFEKYQKAYENVLKCEEKCLNN